MRILSDNTEVLQPLSSLTSKVYTDVTGALVCIEKVLLAVNDSVFVEFGPIRVPVKMPLIPGKPAPVMVKSESGQAKVSMPKLALGKGKMVMVLLMLSLQPTLGSLTCMFTT